MHYVYLIESVNDHERHYVGQTNDLKKRLRDHNDGRSVHTRDFKPWNLAASITMPVHNIHT